MARAAKPLARLVPIRRHGVRKLGQWKGRVTMADDFDAPLDPSELALWEGGNDEGVA